MLNIQIKPIATIAAAPFIVLCLHILFDPILHLYATFHWLDIPMHFLGGAAIAISAHLFINALQKERTITNIHRQARMLFVVSLVALAAIFWEFAEFAGDFFIYQRAYYQPSIGDTMKDLFMGLVGGFITSLILTIKNFRKQ